MHEVPVADWRRALVIIAVLIACSVSSVAFTVEDLVQFVPFYVIPVLMAIPLLARRDATCRAWCLSIGIGEAIMDDCLPVGVFSGMLWYLPSTVLLIVAGLGRARSASTTTGPAHPH